MPLRNVELTETSENFLARSVESGRFSDANAAVEEGLRLLEEREHEDEARLQWLGTAAKEAFDSLDRGEGTTFESTDDLEAYIRAIGAEVRAKAVEPTLV